MRNSLDEDDEVEVTESGRLCTLTLDDPDEDEHEGEWEATLYGECDGDEVYLLLQ